jgi:hypothetical protein
MMGNQQPSAPRLRVRAAALSAIGSFAAVLAAIEAMALRGQVDFGRHVLHLKGVWLAVPPVALEGGTLAAATLTLWAVLARDSATLPRLMTAVLIGAAAYANYQGAKHAHRPTLAADYLAGASVAAYLMWHTILTRVRRSELHEAGAIEAPLPRFRLLRWVFAYSETYAAFKVAIRESITRPEESLALVRRELVPPPLDYNGVEMPTDELVALAAERGGKRRAVGYAAAALGSHEPRAIQQWLAARAIDVDLSYISRTLTRMVQDRRRRELKVAEG